MNKEDFFSNLLEYSTNEGFSFLVSGQTIETPQKLSGGKQALIATAAGAMFGLVGVLSSGYLDETNKQGLIQDLQRLQDGCSLIGIKYSDGPVLIRLGIDGDDILNETLIGRFAIIHERAYDFRKYAPSVLPGGKLAIGVQVVLAFSKHKRAKEFIENYASKCKLTAFWKKVYTQPWVADLEDEEVRRFRQPLSDLITRDSEKLKGGLFRQRT
jgi:hypothetical protein